MATHLRNLQPDELSRLSILATISKMLNASTGVDDMLTRMLDAVLESMNAQCGFLILGRGGKRKVAVTRGIDHAAAEGEYSRTVVDQVFREGVSVLSTDAGHDERFALSKSLHVQKVRSVLCAPLRSQQQTIGAIYLDSLLTTGIFRPSDGEMLEILCDLTVTALERAHYLQRTMQAEAKQRAHLKEVIFSATGGKLQVLLEGQELDEFLKPFYPEVVLNLNVPEDVGRARQHAEGMFSAKLPQNRMQDLVLCISEGATNVVRHGGGGTMSLGELDGRAIAYFADKGPGIDPESLPRATLWPGFSTKMSMGFGFSVLLQLLDKVTLHSGPGGTHLVLQMALTPDRSFEEDLLRRLCERVE